MAHISRYVRALAEVRRHDIDTVGSKAANLAHLLCGGFNVPSGFVITTNAFRAVIPPALDPTGTDLSNVEELGQAAASLRRSVLLAPIPADLVEAVSHAYRELGSPPVAVRSSGTSEDLPGASFAGQHETILHVRGATAVMEAVRSCWASLWTARAVQYRARAGEWQANLAMAVIVQRMALHDVSGVVFTVNPVSGSPDQLLINAAPGSGESLVSGEITPDQWIARRPDGAVVHAMPSAAMTRQPRNQFLAPGLERGCLTASQVRTLSQLALRVEEHFGGVPQDIEWSYGDGTFFLLQSRPITTEVDP